MVPKPSSPDNPNRTNQRYSTRLRYFLNKIGLTGNDRDNRKSMEELCRIFVEKGKQDPNWIKAET